MPRHRDGQKGFRTGPNVCQDHPRSNLENFNQASEMSGIVVLGNREVRQKNGKQDH
jgi:hypothetical protein